MKKIYSLLAASVLSVAAYSQCVPDPNLFGGPGNLNYTIIPDTITNLPIAYVSVAYATDLQFHIQPDTVTSLGTFPITQVHIDSVTGIPANFSYTSNPASGTFTTPTATPPGTGYGCVNVIGTAVAGQETGGPNSDGIYPIIVYYTATVEVFSVPTDFPTTKTGYKLVVMPFNSVPSVAALHFSITSNAPNPADNSTSFDITSPNAGNASFTLYNCLGSLVKQENIALNKGNNTYSFNTSALAEGVYMCSFRCGNNVVTRRITVAH